MDFPCFFSNVCMHVDQIGLKLMQWFKVFSTLSLIKVCVDALDKLLNAYYYSFTPQRLIGPMHDKNILDTHNNTNCLVLVSLLKMGIPLVKIKKNQRFPRFVLPA